MPEYVANAVQTVPVGQTVRFTETAVPCKKGYVLHREGSGIFTLRGIVNNACSCSAQYKVTFGGNIAVPAEETVGAVSLAFAIDGETINGTEMIVTPAAVDEYFNVGRSVFISVPRGCCLAIAVENTSTIPVNIQNANLIIERTA